MPRSAYQTVMMEGGGTTGTDAIVTVRQITFRWEAELDGFVSANGGHIGNIGALVFNVTGDLHPVPACFRDTGNGLQWLRRPLSPWIYRLGCAGGCKCEKHHQRRGFIGAEHLNDKRRPYRRQRSRLLLNATGDINGQQGIGELVSLYGGGQIDGSALVVLNAQNIVTASTASWNSGVDTMALEASIYSDVAGTVGGRCSG